MIKLFRPRKVETATYGLFEFQKREIDELASELEISKSILVRVIVKVGMAYLNPCRRNSAKLKTFIIDNDCASILTEFPKLRDTATGKSFARK